MQTDSVLETVKWGIVDAGSVAWIPAAFGYSILDVGGQTAGIMMATVLGAVGLYSLAEKAGLAE